MLKTIALAALLAATPLAASTVSVVALNGFAFDGENIDLTQSGLFDDTQVFAQALNIGGNSVTATYSGTGDHSAYASTRFQHDALSANRVTFGTQGYINSFGLGHASAIVAAWHMNAKGDTLWQDILEVASCAKACDVSGYAAMSKVWTRMADAGDSLFLTITAQTFSDRGAPVPSSSSRFAFAPGDAFGQAQSSIVRMVSITAVPEPATWAMLIVGFGFVGTVARGRRSACANVAS